MSTIPSECQQSRSVLGNVGNYLLSLESLGIVENSEVDLGNVVTKSLTGLTAGKTYYVAVSTYDTDGNESWYSKEVSVGMNNTPVIAAVSDVTINEEESSTVTLSATDADGDAITYSAVSDTSAIDVSVTSSALKLSTLANWNGVANIKAYASDGYSKDSTSFKLTVTAVNDAPVISAIPDDSTNEETEKAIVVGASDVDGDALTYSASSDTSAVGLTISSDTLKLNPAINYTGTAKITVIVSDNALMDTTSFNFKVINVNDAPVIAAVSDVTFAEDTTGSLVLSATDIDGDGLTYSAKSSIADVATTVSKDTLTLTPAANWNGTSTITAYASDGSLIDSTKFTLTVTAINDAPVITAVANDSTNEETEKSIVLSASDIDGDALTYSASSDTSAVAVTVSTNTLKLTPALNYTGTSVITAIVSDNVLADTTKFDFKVINVNDAPVITDIPDETICKTRRPGPTQFWQKSKLWRRRLNLYVAC